MSTKQAPSPRVKLSWGRRLADENIDLPPHIRADLSNAPDYLCTVIDEAVEDLTSVLVGDLIDPPKDLRPVLDDEDLRPMLGVEDGDRVDRLSYDEAIQAALDIAQERDHLATRLVQVGSERTRMVQTLEQCRSTLEALRAIAESLVESLSTTTRDLERSEDLLREAVELRDEARTATTRAREAWAALDPSDLIRWEASIHELANRIENAEPTWPAWSA
jgi:hypothetical protein